MTDEPDGGKTMNTQDLKNATDNVFFWLYDHGLCWGGILDQIEARIAKMSKAPASESDIEAFLKSWR
jgi:hypothetical protein